jgi:hypothetical protein
LSCGCVAALFIEILVSGKPLYGSDFSSYFRPVLAFVQDHVKRHGELPFWNPYLFSGTPMIGNIQACLFYPLSFLYYLMPTDIAYGYSTLLHFVLGLAFMYLFMRSLGVKRVGCALSGIVFILNGYLMAHLFAGHLSLVQNYIWIPLIFFFLNRFVQGARLWDALWAGLTLGVQILGGFPQIAFYTILASSLLILVGGVFARKREQRSPFKLGAGWSLFVLTGFALAAIQVLPTYEFTTLSTRGGGISYEMATYESLHPAELLAFVLPDLFGNATDGTYWRGREFWHFWESCGYVGLLPLFFLFVRGPQFSWVRVFAGSLILISLFLALGKYNPLYPLVYRLPGFSSFRLPVQILFLYVTGVAILSGLGLSRMLEGDWRLTRGFWIFSTLSGLLLTSALVGLLFFRFEFFLTLFRNFSEGPVTHANLSLLYERMSSTISKACLIFFVSLFLLLLARRRKIGAVLLTSLACLIVFVDLYTFVSPFVRTHEFATAQEKSRLLSQLSTAAQTGRVAASDRLFSTNDGLLYRFPSIQGYDPLILKKYVNFVLYSQGFPPNDHVVNLQDVPDPQEKLITLLNVRQVVSGGQVEKMENAVPYAFLVPNALVKPEDHALEFMRSVEFDPLKTVVFTEQTKHAQSLAESARPFEGSCHLLSHGPEEIRFRVSCNQPAYLVMSEIWYPGWVASVSGQEEEVLCGNYLFRAVAVNQGTHEVIVRFVSWPFRIGALLSAATLGFGVFFGWRGRRGRSFNASQEKASAA